MPARLQLTQAYMDLLSESGHDLLRRHVRTQFTVDPERACTVFGRAYKPSLAKHIRSKLEHTPIDSNETDAIATAASIEAAWLKDGAYVVMNDPVHKTIMSRLHLCIRSLPADRRRYELFDMGSVNGVLVNGEQVPPRTWTELAPHSLLRFCNLPQASPRSVPYAEYEFLLESQEPQVRQATPLPSASSISGQKRKRESPEHPALANNNDDHDDHQLTAEQEAFVEQHRCGICQDLALDVTQPSCRLHLFCRGCLDAWLRAHPTCPMCRHAQQGEMHAMPDVNARISTFVQEAYTVHQQEEYHRSRGVAPSDPVSASASSDAPALSSLAADAHAMLTTEDALTRALRVLQHRIQRANEVHHGTWTVDRALECNTVCRCCFRMMAVDAWRLQCHHDERLSFYHLACSQAMGDASVVRILHQRICLPSGAPPSPSLT